MEASVSDVSCSGVWEWPPEFSRAAQLEQQFRCPLCHGFVTAAVTLKCMHLFCSLCIRQCLDKEDRCPVCRRAATHGDVARDLRFQLCADVFAAARPSLLGAAVRFAPEARAAGGAASGAAAKAGAHQSDLAAAAAAAASIERRRIVAPVYKMKKDADLRKDLGAWGLPTTGAREEIEFRHRQYIHAFNAEQDAPHPRPAAAIAAQVRATEREHTADRVSSRAIARSKIDPLAALFTGGAAAGAARPTAVIEIDDDGEEEGGRAASAANGAAAAAASGGGAQPSPGNAPTPLAAPDQRPFVTVTGAMREGFRRLREELSAREAARKARERSEQERGEASGLPAPSRAVANSAATELSSAAGPALRSHSGAPAGQQPPPAGPRPQRDTPLGAPAPGVDLAAASAAAALLPARFRVVYSEAAGRPFYFDEDAGVGSFEPPVVEGGEAGGAAASIQEHMVEIAAPDDKHAASASQPTRHVSSGTPDSLQARRTPRVPKGRSVSHSAAVAAPAASPAAAAASATSAPPAEAHSAAAPTALLSPPRGPSDAAAATLAIVRTSGVSQSLSQAAAPERGVGAEDEKGVTLGHPKGAATSGASAAAAAASSGTKRRRVSCAGGPSAALAPGDGGAINAGGSAGLDAAGVSTRRGPIAAPPDGPASVGAWQCDLCTFSNKRASRKCQMCNHPRSAPGPQAAVAAAGT